jgi:MFS family permease
LFTQPSGYLRGTPAAGRAAAPGPGYAVAGAQVASLDVAEPLGSRFAKLWTASTTSALGSGLATIAAPLFVAAHTKNPLIVSATTGVAWLPWLLFALPGGVLVDRVDRRRLMVTIDWIRVAVMGVLATALLAGWSSIALLDVALFLINTGEIVFRFASVPCWAA